MADRKGEAAAWRRGRVVDEIVDSEATYLRHLNTLLRTFVEPLRLSRLTTEREVRVLFGELSSIRLVNQVLFDRLCDGDVVGAFAALTPFLKHYTSYARNFPSSQRLLEQLRDRKAFAELLKRQEDSAEAVGLKLPAFLILPIQRIPRYRLLLEQLIDTSDCDLEREQIREILKQLNGVAELVNECIADYENSLKMMSIQKCLESCAPDLMAPGRKFVKEGALTKVSVDGRSRDEQCMLWLFNDTLVYGRRSARKRSKFLCSCVLPLRHCVVYQIIGSNMISLTCKQERLLLRAPEYSAANDWLSTLQAAILEAQEARQTLRKESSRRTPLHRSFLTRVRRRRVAAKTPTAASPPPPSPRAWLDRLLQRKRAVPTQQIGDARPTKRARLESPRARLSTVLEEDSILNCSMEMERDDETVSPASRAESRSSNANSLPWWTEYERPSRRPFRFLNRCSLM